VTASRTLTRPFAATPARVSDARPDPVAVAIDPDGGGARLTPPHEGVRPDHEQKTRDGRTMILAGLAPVPESDHG
jgi:hypothetical protein